jgi:predicted nucleotidyltransferase
MTSYGLTPLELETVWELLRKHFGELPDVKVYLFGSRAKGSHKKYSDVDLAIKTKSKDISQRISLFQEDWEQSKLPYKLDVTSWSDLFRPYLPDIRRSKKILWIPEDREVHPWRVCPYGQHWVVRHPRLPVGRQLQDVDGHCRKNPSGKDLLRGEEIELIAKNPLFQNSHPLPNPYRGKEKLLSPEAFDGLIAGWCKYWNEIFLPDKPITPDFIKALIESESRFNPLAIAQNKKVGPARGLVQLTEQTWRILKDQKGEIKDHYVDLQKQELFDPNKNICAAIRWLFRKREILQKRLSRSPDWVETIAEYKGLGPDLKKKGPKSLKVMNDFLVIYKRYQ